MITNLLKEWSIVMLGGKVYIVGKVYNDIKGRFNDGDEIRTSQILKAYFVNGVV